MYEIMAQELEREKKLELVPSPATESLSEPRNYFYVEFQGQQSPRAWAGRNGQASLSASRQERNTTILTTKSWEGAFAILVASEEPPWNFRPISRPKISHT